MLLSGSGWTGRRLRNKGDTKRMTIERLREFPGLENLSLTRKRSKLSSPGKIYLWYFFPTCRNIKIKSLWTNLNLSSYLQKAKQATTQNNFVKNQKEGVSVILVYSLDRFSRTGDNATFISSNWIQNLRAWKNDWRSERSTGKFLRRLLGKLNQEIKAMIDELKRSGNELRNRALLNDHSMEMTSNLSDFWVSSDYAATRKLRKSSSQIVKPVKSTVFFR